jgi:hypothetical protein
VPAELPGRSSGVNHGTAAQASRQAGTALVTKVPGKHLQPRLQLIPKLHPVPHLSSGVRGNWQHSQTGQQRQHWALPQLFA